MTTTLDAQLARSWVDRWDAQQEFYVTDREERFAVIGDLVAHALDPATSPVVLDLGCGPGSLSARLVQRLPGARVIGVDADPLLLALAQARYGDAIEFVDADLTADGLPEQVPASIDAAVSTTALHWLDPEPLAALYRALAARIRPGGVFVNGDHMPATDPAVRELGRVVQQGRLRRSGVTGNEDWQQWWDAVQAEPRLAELLTRRSDRAVAHHGSNSLSATEHGDLLLAAGFRAAGPVWQSGDDTVLVAIR